MTNIYCDFEKALMPVSFFTYQVLKTFKKKGILKGLLFFIKNYKTNVQTESINQHLELEEYLNEIAPNSDVLMFLTEYKEIDNEEKDFYFFTSEYFSRILKNSKIKFENTRWSFLGGGKFISVNDILNTDEKDVMFLASYKEKKLLKNVIKPIIVGPWWLQWFYSISLKNIVCIDTKSINIVNWFKGIINKLPSFFGYILFVPLLLLRLVFITYLISGGMISSFSNFLFASWPIFLGGYYVNKTTYSLGLCVLLLTIILSHLQNMYFLFKGHYSDNKKIENKSFQDNPNVFFQKNMYSEWDEGIEYFYLFKKGFSIETSLKILSLYIILFIILMIKLPLVSFLVISLYIVSLLIYQSKYILYMFIFLFQFASQNQEILSSIKYAMNHIGGY
jgi:hypothetical protein